MALKYTRELSDEEVLAMGHYVVDVQQWIDDAISGKIASCQKRIVRQEIEKAIDSNGAIAASKQDILGNFFAAPEYKNRKDREALEDTQPPVIVPPIEENPEDGRQPA